MRTIKLVLLALLFSIGAKSQELTKDKNYTKTEHRVKIGKITYFVYQYKTGEYFTIKENRRTGRKYWQALEMVEPKKTV